MSKRVHTDSISINLKITESNTFVWTEEALKGTAQNANVKILSVAQNLFICSFCFLFCLFISFGLRGQKHTNNCSFRLGAPVFRYWLETGVSVWFRNTCTRLTHNERDISLMHEAKMSELWTISNSLCNQQVHIFVNKKHWNLRSLHCKAR